MNTPEWLKPGIYGAVIGAVVAGLVGFSWGGWVTAATADKMADARSRDEVTSALVPVCLDMARTDPDRIEQLATIRQAASFKRKDAVMATGWATIPGASAPNADLAQACIKGLELDA